MEKFYQKIEEISVKERKCTYYLLKQWRKTKPFLGKKILINGHFTNSTLLLVELFIEAGADIRLTCSDSLVCHDEILAILKDLNLYIEPYHLKNNPAKYLFDIILDCGAFFADTLSPNIGFVELTQVSPSSYYQTNCPVINVDGSFVKKLETMYGTGDGFVRAIDGICNEHNQDFRKQKYLIFGYGKVGEGIAACLHLSGIIKSNITIVEISDNNLNKARSNGYYGYSLINEMNLIQSKINNDIDCAITATGVTDCISRYFSVHDFNNVPFLANMGTYDEWGYAFETSRILNNKKPLNFLLQFPTQVTYLDPIFALLACATLDITEQRNVNEFSLSIPKIETQKQILDIWLSDNVLQRDVESLWMNEKNQNYQTS